MGRANSAFRSRPALAAAGLKSPWHSAQCSQARFDIGLCQLSFDNRERDLNIGAAPTTPADVLKKAGSLTSRFGGGGTSGGSRTFL